MSDRKLGPAPQKVDPVAIDLGDGKERTLAYPIRTLLRMKLALGRSVFGGAGVPLDEEMIPVLIWHGLHDEVNDTPPDVSVEYIAGLRPAQSWLKYLLEAFLLAYTGSLPEPKKPTAPPEAPAEKPN